MAVRLRPGPLDQQRQDREVVELVDTRRSERRATRGVGVRISPWLLTETSAGEPVLSGAS